MNSDNFILIGMPGCGKSTVGVVLAKALGCHFLDSDLAIQAKEGKKLHEIIEERGQDGFRQVENEVNASLDCHHTVIATGGSVIYGPEAMAHLRSIGTVIYLKLSHEEIAHRLGDLHKRGVTLKPGQTLKDLYEERIPLYEKYAHWVVECEGLRLRQVVQTICQKVEAC